MVAVQLRQLGRTLRRKNSRQTLNSQAEFGWVERTGKHNLQEEMGKNQSDV